MTGERWRAAFAVALLGAVVSVGWTALVTLMVGLSYDSTFYYLSPGGAARSVVGGGVALVLASCSSGVAVATERRRQAFTIAAVVLTMVGLLTWVGTAVAIYSQRPQP